MALIDDTYALIASTRRNIGGIIPDCVVEERHFDRLSITEHPVETGAAITDHAFRNPSEVTMKIGFSNSTARTEGWVQQAYQMLLGLQEARQPFSVSTGKRSYTNMLVELLEVETDPTSEFMLNCTAALKEIIIVSTQQSSGGVSSVASNQTVPQSTMPLQSTGSVPTTPAPNASPYGDLSKVHF